MQTKKFYILLSLIFFAQLAFGQKYQFRMNEPPKDSFFYRVTESIDFFIKSDESIDTSMELKVVDYKFLLKAKTSDTKQNFDVTIKNIFITKSDAEKPFLYDSKKINSGVSAKGYDKLINHNFDVNFDNLGNLETISGFNTIYEKDFGGADAFSTIDFGVVKDQVKSQFSNQTVEYVMRYFRYNYIEDSLEVGDYWMVTDTVYPSYGVISTMTYTLKEIKNNIAYLEIKADLKKDPNFKGIDMDMMHLKFNLQGQQEGLVLLDMNTGWVRKMSVAQRLTGKMTVFFIDPQGVTMKIEVKGATDYDMINY
ncbi:MAG: hypothetical protein ACJAUH_002468 [Saprospiraceae bacterium]|jgi:hypothetical protein